MKMLEGKKIKINFLRFDPTKNQCKSTFVVGNKKKKDKGLKKNEKPKLFPLWRKMELVVLD